MIIERVLLIKQYYEKLQNLRKEKGYTYKQMAELLNISKCYYWQIENKERGLTYQMALKIAIALGTKPDDLFLDEVSSGINI